MVIIRNMQAPTELFSRVALLKSCLTLRNTQIIEFTHDSALLQSNNG